MVSNLNLLESRRRILLTTPHLESPTPANPLTFKSNMTTKLKEGKVYFTPVQDLHGYDNPWPAGGGKNKFDYLDSNNWYVAETDKNRKKVSTLGSISVSNGVVKLSRSSVYAGLVLVLGQLKADQSYAFGGITTNIDGNAYIAKIDSTLSDEYTATRVFTIAFSDNSVTFTPTENGIYELLLWKNGVGDITIKNAQLELGNTATSYQPYENVCPITGWDGISVTKCGKNLVPPVSEWTPGWIDGYGTIASPINTQKEKYSDYIPVHPNSSYAFSYDLNITGVAPWVSFACYDKNKKFLRRPAPSNLKITTNSNEYYIRVSMRTYDAVDFVQFELGATSSSYEPYTETQITIPFPKTIYGGYVDLVNGEVVEEWESFALDGEENNIRELNRGQSAHRFDFYLTNLHGSAKVASTEWLCNRMTYDSSSTALFGTFRMYNTTNLVIGNGDNMLADLAAFKQWLSENTPEFCAPLATSIHHTIDPQVIRPLKGTNTIYSDANGNIEIKFWKH